jgi:predicted enzyme related to lactoylglutathione lyase
VGLANEPGSLCWNENISRAFDQNQAFYQAVFGYEYGDLSGDGYRYATLKVNGTEVGGIGESDRSTPADVPAHWSTYFGAADTDAAAQAASAAGGRVIQPPRDSPYGRIAVVADDQGATFSLISPPPP